VVQVYDLLIETYQAREDLRDYSGHTASYYLEHHIQVIQYKLKGEYPEIKFFPCFGLLSIYYLRLKSPFNVNDRLIGVKDQRLPRSSKWQVNAMMIYPQSIANHQQASVT
jgi:hypothetical protein